MKYYKLTAEELVELLYESPLDSTHRHIDKVLEMERVMLYKGKKAHDGVVD